MPQIKVPLAVRFAAKCVLRPNGCIEWAGFVDKRGYARINDGSGEILYAHRYAYETAKGPIPDGWDIDHLCRNRCCVNHQRLEAVTRRENCLRGQHVKILIHLSDTCGRGHPRTSDNIYMRKDRPGLWNCRKCHNENQNSRRAARRGQNVAT